MGNKKYKNLNIKNHPVSAKGRSEKSNAAMLSIISNCSLVLMKLLAGLFSGSVAIMSEAVHSGMDLMASLMAYISVRIADSPADEGHPFGHGKAENLAALFEGLLILFAGLWIAWKAGLNIKNPPVLPGLKLGALVMFISAVVNIIVSSYLFRVGKRTESAALIADAWHLRTDVYTSSGVFVALCGIMIGAYLVPDLNLNILDPLCALVVAILIIKAAYSLSRGAVMELIDSSLSDDELALIMNHIQAMAPDIKGYSIKSRRSGSCRIIYMTLNVDGSMPVEEGHRLGDVLVERISEHFPNSQINFHLEPV